MNGGVIFFVLTNSTALITITILDIIHRSVSYFKKTFGDWICLHLQVESTQLGPIKETVSFWGDVRNVLF
jgi:hypothetical protein